ncbi:hypothetical protein [Actinophytocola gossypii]|uniref:DUF1707 domain-containing protein n=1 Tax=Actinophytocola gossypii TaxID=2812003 RepID=A0ABT2JFD2_9PSEU|nr:hypothetical protein [Actinophytocola gossypii]MCT2586583.1 hypothetical protein [Actinophytocola gossypii]
MSWQDELRRLDEELAAGRISADDYRSRRDHILSTAVAPGAEPPSSSESTTMMPPVQPQQGNQNQQGDADKTQIVSGQDLGDSDRTQSVGWRATPPDDPNRTQVVPGVPPQAQAGARPLRPAPPPGPHSPPEGFPQQNQQNQPPWQAEENLAPPWAGQEFPPLAAAGTPDWARQGPEVFETEKKSSPAKVFGIIAIVVVLVGIAAGAYFLFRPDEGDTEAGPGGNENPPASETTAPPSETEPQGPIAELPGSPQDLSRIETFADVETIDHLTPEEVAIYKQGGAGDAAMALSRDNDVTVIVVYTTMTSEAAAATARDELAALQLKFQLKKIDAPAGVLASRNPDTADGQLTRAHYVSGSDLIRIQTIGQDADAANQLFEDVLADQLEMSPVDG